MMELTPPNKSQLKNILEDINLTEEQLKRDTITLREWLHTQPHLPHNLDDKLLASFLVGSKNSLERAKHNLDTYLTNRTTCQDFYQSRDPCDPDFRKLNKHVQYFLLPKMTPEGYRVSVFRLRSPDISGADIDLRLNAIKVLSSYDARFLEENYWAGDITIVDFQNFGLKHIQAVTILPLLKRYMHCVNESLPVRYKKIIFINLSSFMEPVLNMIKKILKQKVVQRMIMSTEDFTFLHSHIPHEILPDEYGGKAGSLDELNDAWQLKVESYRDWFLTDMKRRVDESKRPMKSSDTTKQVPVHGLEGSFRTLMID